MKKITIKRIQDKVKHTLDKMKTDSQIAKEISKLNEDWLDIMYELGLKTTSDNTYTLLDIKKTSYGYHCNIYATKGLNLDDLEKAKLTIETGMGCIFLYYVKKKGSKTAEAKFITEGFGGNKAIYIPPKTTANELYIGNSVEGTPVIISAKDVSHFLLSGSNGGGKSRLLDIIITTLIYNCDESQLELYLGQIAKNDLVVYEDAKCCRAFAETLDEVETMLTHIVEKTAERTKLIKPMRKDFLGSDIYAYNQLHPLDKMSVCWVIFDEISSIMEKTGNNKKVAQQKDRIKTMIEEIARIGRAMGIFLGVCLQRCTADMLSPLVKSQTNLRISFAQNNMKSSEVAMDDPSISIGLNDRVAVYSCRARGFDFVKTPYMDDKVIEKYIKAKSKRGHRNLFTDLKKLNAPAPKIKDVSKSEEEIKPIEDKGSAPAPIKKRNKGKAEVKENKEIKLNIPSSTLELEVSADKIAKLSHDIKIVVPYTPLKFDNVDPNTKLKENTNNIIGYIPYKPISNSDIVVDQTILNLSKIQDYKFKIKG